MTLKPCVQCGEPSTGNRCPQHRPKDTKPSRQARGYDSAWDRLSQRARRLQPFCTDCGATENLQTDHTPQAWARYDAGKTIRLQDVRVLCGPCNRAAGAARGNTVTRGDAPSDTISDPVGKAKFESEMA